MNIAALSGALALIGTIAGGVIAVETRYETVNHHEETLALNEKKTRDYLIDLRIDQYEFAAEQLNEKSRLVPLKPYELRKLKSLEKRIEGLYQIKEGIK